MKKGYVYIGLAALLFSTMEIALKLFSLGYNPLQLNLLRFAIGALVLLPFAIASLGKKLAGQPPLGWGDAGFFALSGFICVVVSMGFYQIAVTRTPAAVVAVIFSCNPIFVVPLAAWMLGEKVSGRTVLALAASVVGIACISAPAFAAKGGLDLLGIAFTVLSAIVFAFYGVMGKARSKRYGGLAMTCGSFVAGTLELFALILLTRVPAISAALTDAGLGVFASVPILAGLGLADLPGLLYLGICVTGFGYAFYFLGMEATSAQTGSIVFFIKPALAPVLALLVLRESIPPLMLLGIAFIVGGSGLLLARRKAA